MPNFERLYDTNEEYILRRDPESYNAKRIAAEVESFKIPNLLGVLPEDYFYASIAEIGCATGEIVATFPGANVKRRVGFDISPLNLKAARERFPGVTFLDSDFRNINDTFDLIIMSDILEHLPNPADILRSAANIGKLVVVNLPLEKCLLNRFRKYGLDDPSGHLRAYSIAEGLALFQNAGLSVKKCQRKWSFESQYELVRQDLNRKIRGKRFSGNLAQRILKTGIFSACSHFKWVGRKLFAANLFASVEMNE